MDSMDAVRSQLAEVLERVRGRDDGRTAQYIPELAEADPDRLALSVVGPRGGVVAVGDESAEFTIQSISKPFVFAIALEQRGREDVLERVGVEPSGEPFNAISLEEGSGRPTNPLVNAGAIATTGMIDGADTAQRSGEIVRWLSRFAGRSLRVDESVYASESETGDRNRAFGHLLRSHGLIDGDVDAVVESYFRQCSVLVTVGDLATMASTLAFGGRNPVTGERVVSERTARDVVSVMTSCGMYDASGMWLMRVGLPAKSGVSGGLLALSPSQFGVGVFSPRLDRFGNSVRGQLILEDLSDAFGMHVLDRHESIASPGLRVERGDDLIRIVLDGELTFSGAERVLTTLSEVGVDRGKEVVIDATALSQLHPAARSLLRSQLEAAEGPVRLEVGDDQ